MLHGKTVLASVAILTLCGWAARPALAAPNLVVDGGFESDTSGNYFNANDPFAFGAPSTFGPWTAAPISTFSEVSVDGFAVQADAGNNSLDIAPNAGPDGVTQTLATTVGQSYDLSFYAAVGGANTVAIKFGGSVVPGSPTTLTQTIPMFANDYTGDYRLYSLSVVATSASSVLEFDATDPAVAGQGPDTVNIDNVSLSVPEPATAPLAGLGAAGLLAARRRHVARAR